MYAHSPNNLGCFEYDSNLFEISTGTREYLKWIGGNKPVVLPKGLKKLDYMFLECEDDLDFSQIDTSEIISMAHMFWRYKGTELDLSTFDTRNVQAMHGMFYFCKNLKRVDLTSFSYESLVRAEYMFSGCVSLECLDLSSINCFPRAPFEGVLEGCKSLKVLDLSNMPNEGVDYLLSTVNMKEEGGTDILLEIAKINYYINKKEIILPKRWMFI